MSHWSAIVLEQLRQISVKSRVEVLKRKNKSIFELVKQIFLLFETKRVTAAFVICPVITDVTSFMA